MSKYKFKRGPSTLSMLLVLFIAFGSVWYMAGGTSIRMPGFKIDREKEEQHIALIRQCREIVKTPQQHSKKTVKSCEKILNSL